MKFICANGFEASFEPIVFRVWFTMPQLSRRSVDMIKRSRNYPEASQLEDFLEGLAKRPFLGTSFERWLIRKRNSGVLQHVSVMTLATVCQYT